jgi:hypothetical protein
VGLSVYEMAYFLVCQLVFEGLVFISKVRVQSTTWVKADQNPKISKYQSHLSVWAHIYLCGLINNLIFRGLSIIFKNMFMRLPWPFLVPIIYVVGCLQYASVGIEAISNEQVSLSFMDSTTQENAGFLRYIKDGFILLFGLWWPFIFVRMKGARRLRSLVKVYLAWMTTFVMLGLVGFLLDLSPWFFLPAGLRWILLLHASFGVFILIGIGVASESNDRTILRILLFISILNVLVICWQGRGISHLGFVIGSGGVRLTGIFNGAGPLSFFGFGMVVVGMNMNKAPAMELLLLSMLAMLMALASGSRLMMICIFIIMAYQIYEVVEYGQFRRFRGILRSILFVGMIVVGYFGYVIMIEYVDRGNMFEQQISEGGRVANFLHMVDVLAEADFAELMFGRGLGVGTNTAQSLLEAMDVSPESFRFNWLVDNAFLTLIFQVGLLGSLLFWGGFCALLFRMRPRNSKKMLFRYLLLTVLFLGIMLAGNPFEHYFIMMSCAIGYGLICLNSFGLLGGNYRRKGLT